MRLIISLSLFLAAIVLVAFFSYWKGFNDHRLNAIEFQLSANAALLRDLQNGKVGLVEGGLGAQLGGELATYQKLSKNPLIMLFNDRTKQRGRVEAVGNYYKSLDPRLKPAASVK